MTHADTKPVILIIFGGTGDLFRRKLAPSLMTLHEEGQMPSKLHIIGTGRTSHSDAEYRQFTASAIHEILSVDAQENFLSKFSYVSGEIQEQRFYERITDTIQSLEKAFGSVSRIVWYCSIAPHFYADIAHGISTYTPYLKRPHSSNAFLIEKPIGHNAVSCLELNAGIAKYFDETQITRIEHYLTKETLVQLPHFFSVHQDIYELMSGQSVDSIEVFFNETIGVEKRGAFYDSVGALRDVGQNHALEMLAHTCMDYPSNALDEELRIGARISFLSELAETNTDNLNAKRFQYSGYRSIPGVTRDSQTETAYEVSGFLPMRRWNKIPFVLRGGKRLSQKKKCIELRMHDNVLHVGKVITKITISIDPESVILSYADSTEVTFPFRPNHMPKYQYVEEYARILSAAFENSRRYSVSSTEVMYLWNIADRYTDIFTNTNTPLIMYEPDSDPFIN